MRCILFRTWSICRCSLLRHFVAFPDIGELFGRMIFPFAFPQEMTLTSELLSGFWPWTLYSFLFQANGINRWKNGLTPMLMPLPRGGPLKQPPADGHTDCKTYPHFLLVIHSIITTCTLAVNVFYYNKYYLYYHYQYYLCIMSEQLLFSGIIYWSCFRRFYCVIPIMFTMCNCSPIG